MKTIMKSGYIFKSNEYNSNQITDAYFVVKKESPIGATKMFEAKKI